MAIPLTLVCTLVVLNQWVGYYPTLQRAWGDVTAGPLPDQADAKDADEFREKGALPDLCAAAVAVHIGCSLRVYPGYHTWQFAARAFANVLPWIAQR